MTYEINFERSSVESCSNCDATSGSDSGCVGMWHHLPKIIAVATISSREKIWILIVILTTVPLNEGMNCGR
jgi:hypothetical protein